MRKKKSQSCGQIKNDQTTLICKDSLFKCDFVFSHKPAADCEGSGRILI